MEEVWHDAKDEKIKGLVEVSNLGRARHKDSKKICKLHDNGAGYLAVACTVDKKVVLRYIHRLVAQVFHNNTENLPQVGHKDDDKANNRPENLYWCSGSKNIRDAHRTGRMKKRSDYGTTSRYEEKVVDEAYRSVVIYGEGISQTAKRLGMPRTTLSSMINKRSWTHLTDKIDDENPLDKPLTNPVE